MPARTPEGKIDALALAVARGLSVRGAARELGLSESTGSRLAARAGFDARVARFRGSIVNQTVGALASASLKAVLKLVALIDSADDELAFRACRAVLADLVALQSHGDLSSRLEALEQAAPPAPASRRSYG